MAGGVCGGHAWQGGVHGKGGGASVVGEKATAADGTHPTGMHSCTLHVLIWTKNTTETVVVEGWKNLSNFPDVFSFSYVQHFKHEDID